MICRICQGRFEEESMTGLGKLYCRSCYAKRREFIEMRKQKLQLLQALPLEDKILMSKRLVDEAVSEYGLERVYISYSGGKDSTVLSHLIRQKYPDILHIFSNTTCEYPETMQHVKWEKEHNGMNVHVTKPMDKDGRPWHFKRVVEEHGFPLFSKRISNGIRTYRRAKSARTKQNALDYIRRNFPKYEPYKEHNISDICCEKLKVVPLKQAARRFKMECAIIGTLAEESYQRELDWIKFGCNVFEMKKDSQCRPLSFWTEQDILDYIEVFNVKISGLYQIGYRRNGCMFCGFGILQDIEDGLNRFQRLQLTHPKPYSYLVRHFGDLLEECDIAF
ncbi:MAG: phosphoadenosine phosphosulfate reductase family protein [Limnochordia bacterium]|jgi:3'-phosphoadenosine 5'-phosphosulfate sulfotransferase (PAPS reductase)/FAD synthetase